MLDKTFRLCKIRILFAAGVAQLVERNLAKVEVASSRLVSRSSFFFSLAESQIPIVRASFRVSRFP